MEKQMSTDAVQRSEHLSEIVRIIKEQIERLPNPPREKIKKEISSFEEFFIDARPPRLMITGRRGSGKSSLINAIFGKEVSELGHVRSKRPGAKWHNRSNEKGSIDILDTRGLGDRTIPESSEFKNAIDEVKSAVEKVFPDIITFLCKATEVDARISEDITDMKSIRDYILDRYSYETPILAVTTKVDELDPVEIVEPPYDDPEKKKNIKEAVDVMSEALQEEEIDIMKIIPMSAYARWNDGVIEYSRYWNIDLFVEYLLEAMPNEAQLELARLSRLKAVQKKVGKVLIGSTATICAGIAATPLPLADAFPITLAQIAMVTGIGYISGRELSREAAYEFFIAIGANIGVAMVLRTAARALIRIVFPGVGNVISAMIASAGTWAIGEAAIAYFIEKKPIEEAKHIFNETYSKRKKE